MKFWDVLYILLFILVMMTEYIDPRFCIESRNTWKVVQSCPTSQAGVKERARKKDCGGLANAQNCSDPSRYKYHCVVNAQETELVEVCAPVYIMLGFCAEYNYDGARIQDHYDRECTAFSSPCPNRYISTDAYRFSGCYEWVTRHQNSTSRTRSAEITTPFMNDNASKSDVAFHMSVWIWIAVLLAVTVVLSLLIVSATLVCYWRIKALTKQIYRCNSPSL